VGSAGTLAVVGVAVLAGTSRGAPRAASQVSLAESVAVVMSTFDINATAVGELEARRQIEVRSQLEQPTTIVDVVREGVNVKAGEVLVKLNADSIQQQIDEEMLRVETARADLAVAENAYEIQINENDSALRKAILAVELAELDQKQWLDGDVTAKRSKLDLDLDKAKRELDRLSDRYQRSQTLIARDFISRDELKRDELAFLEAQAALQTADLNRRIYEQFEYPKGEKTKRSTLEEAVAEVERVRRKNESQLASRNADRINQRQQLTVREGKLAKLREQLEGATLRAPSDGMVVHATSLNRDRWGGDARGTMEVGRQVTRNELLIVLPDTSEMVASVRVPESVAGRVRPGQTASVKIDALQGRSVRGEVLSVGVLAESGGFRDPNLREYTVKIRLDDSALNLGVPLRPSMRCEAEIALDRVERALAVPVQAVFTDGPVRFAYVEEGEGWRRKPVKMARRSDRYVEILAGLAEGQRVLVRAPAQNEVAATAWDKAELNAAGLDLSGDGKVIAMPRPGADTPKAAGTDAKGSKGDRPRGPGSPGTPASNGSAPAPGERPAPRPADATPSGTSKK
ncbi:MAG: HlyD family efflux transporter periplasmic adaptor subunit, partial [Phycisphaerales bacterium]|nr:HlyD family efflux transporter periplasmic adaptor subunit [Phycisphaerales bacterium]